MKLSECGYARETLPLIPAASGNISEHSPDAVQRDTVHRCPGS